MSEASMALQKDLETAFRYFGVNPTSATPYSDVTQSRKKTKHVKRPMNAFMYWAQKERRRIIADNPDIHNATISKTLGAKWKSMTADEKKPHEYVAKLLVLLHQFEYPSYKYCPKKRGARKTDRDGKLVSSASKKESVLEPAHDDGQSEFSDSSVEEMKPIFQPVQNPVEVPITSESLRNSRKRSADSLESDFWELEPISKVPHNSTNAVSPSGSLESEPFSVEEYDETESEYVTDIDVFSGLFNLDFESQQIPPYQGLVTSKIKVESDYNNNTASANEQLFATPCIATTLVSQPFLHFANSPSPLPYDTTPAYLCDSYLPPDLRDIEIFPDIL